MMRFRPAALLSLCLCAMALVMSPVHAQTAPAPVVRAVMFWMNGCPHCEDVIQNVLPPLHEKYGAQFDLLMLEVVDTQDIDTLYRVADSYHIPKEQTGVPFLIIGDHVLVGSSQVREQLPSLIKDYLARGGVDLPENPVLSELVPTAQATSVPAGSKSASSSQKMQSDGFTLAILVMIAMAAVLVYSLAALAIGRALSMPAWTDWLIPALILAGIAVASYLSYIEARSVTAICGPVGDCNAVQQSRYTRLFGVLPIGVLGLLGYIGLLASWLVRRFMHTIEKLAAIAFWGMSFFAVIFSIYLTYLEPFVIKAVCLWCLSSAVIVTSLLLLGTSPAVRLFVSSEEQGEASGR